MIPILVLVFRGSFSLLFHLSVFLFFFSLFMRIFALCGYLFFFFFSLVLFFVFTIFGMCFPCLSFG